MTREQQLDGYKSLIPRLEKSQREQFYRMLMHDLTIVGRAVSRYQHLNSEEKLLFCQALNEIQHSLTSKQLKHQMGGPSWCDDDFLARLDTVIRHCPALENSLSFAVRHSYNLSAPNSRLG